MVAVSRATQPRLSHTAPPAPQPSGARARAAAVWVGLAVLAAVALLAYEPLGPRALIDDLGIQFHLSELTAQGAVPLIDFEHGWNAGAWYYGAFLYWLAGGNPDLWAFLWWHATGSFLAAACVLLAGWRARLEAGWLLGLVAALLVLTEVVHAKYAVPAAWLVLLVPTSRHWPLPWAVGLRAGLAGVTAFAHLELAILLGAGVALYELFATRRHSPRERLLRAAAAPVGVLLALGGQAAVYAALGLGPVELLRQLVGQAEVDPEFHFGYPLLGPRDIRMWLFPVSLVVAFVPLVWRRLSEPARLSACLHLALGLIALRRTDPSHVAAATTLLAPLLVFAGRDLVRAPRPALDAAPARGVVLGLAGSVWFAAAILAGFRIESLLAGAALGLVCLGGILASWAGERPWFSLGAFSAAAVLLVASLAGAVAPATTTAESAAPDGPPADRPGEDALAAQVAAEVRDPLRACTGGDPRVWVVPYPLGLYRELDLTNPTPFVMFWYPFRGEHERVRALVEAGAIPAILEFNRWPLTFDRELAEFVEERFELCAEVAVPATGDTVRVWTHAGG